MRRQVVPDQDDLLPSDKVFELFEKGDQTRGVVTVWLGARQQPRLLSVPAKTQGCCHRGFAPVVATRFQDRGVPPRRPGAPDGGLLSKTRFVLEEDPGLAARSVFFSSGHRTVRQYSTF